MVLLVKAKIGACRTTFLHAASSLIHLESVSFLCDHGAHVDAQDSTGLTALHLAAKHGVETVVAELLARGAAADVQSDGGWTPLHFALQSGFTGVGSILIEGGADAAANLTEEEGGESPLYLYCEFISTLKVRWEGSTQYVEKYVEMLLNNGGSQVPRLILLVLLFVPRCCSSLRTGRISTPASGQCLPGC